MATIEIKRLNVMSDANRCEFVSAMLFAARTIASSRDCHREDLETAIEILTITEKVQRGDTQYSAGELETLLIMIEGFIEKLEEEREENLKKLNSATDVKG